MVRNRNNTYNSLTIITRLGYEEKKVASNDRFLFDYAKCIVRNLSMFTLNWDNLEVMRGNYWLKSPFLSWRSQLGPPLETRETFRPNRTTTSSASGADDMTALMMDDGCLVMNCTFVGWVGNIRAFSSLR